MGSEEALAATKFESIAEQSLQNSQTTTLRKRNGTQSIAAMYSNVFPYANKTWPFVAIDGFDEIAESVMHISGRTRGYMYSPLVYPHQVKDFEAFAFNYFDHQQRPPFESPEMAGLSAWGRGVWAMNSALNSTDKRYHDTSGVTNWNSPFTFLAPFLQLRVTGPPGLPEAIQFTLVRWIDGFMKVQLKRMYV